MRIIPFDEAISIEEIETLSIFIRAIPFESGYAPAMFIESPYNDYTLSLDELNSLMDGIEIAHEKVSEIINFIINTKTFKRNQEDL
jgi:hypothetical protein